jgi:hypothetical protein
MTQATGFRPSVHSYDSLVDPKVILCSVNSHILLKSEKSSSYMGEFPKNLYYKNAFTNLQQIDPHTAETHEQL